MRFLFSFALLLSTLGSNAQMTLTGKVKPGDTLVFNVPFNNWQYEQFSHTTVSDKNGYFSIILPVNKPQTIFLKDQNTRLQLYTEPGQTLHLEKTDSLRFSGGLQAENEFRRKTGLTYFRLGEETWNKALTHPEHILEVLNTNRESALSALRASRFSTDFTRITEADIRYFPVSRMWDLLLSHSADNQSKYPVKNWEAALARAYSEIRISDSSAVNSHHYKVMVNNYLFYIDNQMQDPENREALIKKIWGKSIEELNNEEKGKRYWEYRILNYGFEGVSLEYVLASFITHGIAYGDLDYLNEAYDDFCERFPGSRYLAHVQQIMQPYLQSREMKEISGITFATEAPENLDVLIKQFKGKALYIDMWGTWCGPCRREFAFNKALKEHFAAKDVTFLYIAVEFSPDPVKRWKETVKFYDLTGHHILAGKSLEEDLRKKCNRDGVTSFPTYILVDKTGKVVTLNARKPSEKEALYKQINEQL